MKFSKDRSRHWNEAMNSKNLPAVIVPVTQKVNNQLISTRNLYCPFALNFIRLGASSENQLTGYVCLVSMAIYDG